ncbi:MAG TPA: ABC transporter substrate-binding protein [Stellaceae bacterium]|nr:ABC transporter substrate-binding protein [Stellaceae bacterium]
MRRRAFIAGLAAASCLVVPARAQNGKIYRLGFLSATSFAANSGPGRLADGILGRLARDGFPRRGSLALEKRGAETRLERLPALVSELAASKVDVIVAAGYPAAAEKQGAPGIPIVAVNTGDPVETGLVRSLGRPGGNLTGISDVATELAPKRLEILKDVAPGLRRVAMLWTADDLGMELRYDASAAAARKLGVAVRSFGMREPRDFDRAFAATERALPDGLLVVAGMTTTLNRGRVYDFANAHRLPAIYETAAFARDGGLLSYGPDGAELVGRAASLVERILQGTSPAALPLEQPTRFRLVVNLKTAKAIGLEIPRDILARADEVIE